MCATVSADIASAASLWRHRDLILQLTRREIAAC
jgi:hypothetical protein